MKRQTNRVKKPIANAGIIGVPPRTFVSPAADRDDDAAKVSPRLRPEAWRRVASPRGQHVILASDCG
jgi:hypothetical protein